MCRDKLNADTKIEAMIKEFQDEQTDSINFVSRSRTHTGDDLGTNPYLSHKSADSGRELSRACTS